ncbi:hypothetical protein BT67DRAFT_447466 [Trichocladium antarcticum]|uniref:NADH dehydrogenase [ubiquinone] 1 alpha subcomplex subunit n=1 Tax=Trichocladium antarcticum TaxID=1450529 RepID=A0AAN6URN9_9PEZI|nr:hypothetical protein BT67DRAFT_447466 [Trichocladium antarcticum]
MSYITRTLGNIRKIGLKEYWHQLNVRDTKAGVLIGTDKFGNNAHIEPLWHAWISYLVDTPPPLEPLAKMAADRAWAPREHVPNRTFSRAAYKPYNTTKDKIQAWQPFAAPR